MATQERGGSASPRGDQGSGTQGSPVGRRSRLVDVDRKLRATDRLLEQDRLELKYAPKDKLTSEQQAKPPLTSTGLRGKLPRAAEHDSGSRRSRLPDLNPPQPRLRSDLPGLRSPLPGLCSDLPGLSAPLSGLHVPPTRGQDELPPRGQAG